MRITTWNVNGLRAVIRKGALDWITSEGPDVLCLQEIKVRPEQLTGDQRQLFQGYSDFWQPAAKPGYSGVATFTRRQPLEVKTGVGIEQFDEEGRVIAARYPGFTLFNVYFPSGQRGYERVTFKLEFYACLLQLVDELHAAGENLVICGDFNTAHQEIDLRYPKQNQKTSGFLPEERAWIDRYLGNGLVDAYRALYPERAQYTWWTYRLNARQRDIGWRLDYFLVSKTLLPRVRDVIVHKDIDGSDHCPVSIVLES